MKQLLLILVCCSLVCSYGCSTGAQFPDIDSVKDEILATERAFSKMAGEKGIAEAFLFFADENAVLMRNDLLIEGKEAIRQMLEGPQPEGALLEWEPDFVDVSRSGDLGYTYGTFRYSLPDSSGRVQTRTGVFHTVWKRQPDGSWKYVWD